MDQTPKDLPVGPLGKEGAWLAKFERMDFDWSDVKLGADEWVKPDATCYNVPARILWRKGQTGGFAKLTDVLGFNKSEVFVHGSSGSPRKVSIPHESVARHGLHLVK